MQGLIIDISYTDCDLRWEFIPVSAIASIKQVDKTFEIAYGTGSFLLVRKSVSADELVVRDYSEYLDLYRR